MLKKDNSAKALIDKSLIEAGKSTFANICFTKVDSDIKTICVTSANASEGKSTVSLNLAIAIADSGKRTLLIENDMRKRSLSGALGISAKHDLCDLIRGNVAIMDAVVATDYENLFFLDVAPGVPSPSDILGSERYTRLIGRLEERFDYIIIDTPPVLLFVDAAIIASIADATVLVIKEKSTKKSSAAKALSQLKKANAKIVGISMSCCQVHKSDYYYYSYYSSETGEKVGRSSHSSSKLDFSDLEHKEKPIWDVDYDESVEKLPEQKSTAKSSSKPATKSTSQSASKTTSGSTAKSTSSSTAKPSAKTTTKPVEEPKEATNIDEVVSELAEAEESESQKVRDIQCNQPRRKRR